MLNLEEIHIAESKVKSGADFPAFIQEIKAMGVTRNDVYVINGMSTYFGTGDEAVQGPPIYEDLIIEPESSISGIREALKIHQNGETDYQTFCRQAAAAGVEKWVTDLNEMTVIYIDMAGNELVVEKIPEA
ncbi:DUF1398 domain-containing protein [Pedobacter frigiditerrae]|uniref:DUF1398 domain-containing protein n=1 Tax=Pedobacter frigiditerrae TaxID=2530452 RepID=A0A4R0MT96_9SPHI|nr:DUF1398 family protein [Pedobacter frigiditerrae]TCC90240.1 DUF1398 domain-containing protein [Pedobacter frigiditerrae]